MVSVTREAREKIRHTLEAPGMESYALRLGLSGGACTGKFLIGLDQPTASDETYFIEGIQVIIDRKHLMYLAGKKLDYLTENGDSFFALI